MPGVSAHSRLVRVKRRADSRAGTEPHPRAPSEVEHTSPYPRSFEPAEEGRESVPYLEVEITTEKQPSQPSRRVHQRTTRVVKTVSRKLGVGTGTETALPSGTESAITGSESAITSPCAGRAGRVADIPTIEPTAPFERTDELDQSTERVAKVIESLTEPNGPAVRPSHLQWLGVVLTQPVVGAALVIGTWLRADFCVTSPVTKIFPRDGGVLVHTHNDSSYFVETSGDTYLVRRGG
jgi:hypothetical protein